MNKTNNTKALVESSILTSIAIVLILMSIYLPIVSIAVIFIWPIPITFIYVRHGMKYGILSLVITFLITSMIAGPLTALGLVVVYGLLSLVLGYCITTKKSSATSIIIMAIAALLSTMVLYKIFSAITGQDIIARGMKLMTETQGTYKDIYIKMGIPKDTIEKTMGYFPSIDVLKMILPAAFILYSIGVAFICYLLTQKILKRFKYFISEIKPLSEWYIPFRISFGIIIIFGISFLFMRAGVQNGEGYFVNANILFNYTFTINALAFVAAFMKKRGIRRPVSWLVMIFCILPPIGTYLFFLGVFDYIIDYRKLDPSRKRPTE